MRVPGLVAAMITLLACRAIFGRDVPPELTQRGMTESADRDLVAVEAEMKQTLEMLLERAKDKPAAVAKLRKAQASWEAYRDAQLDALWPSSDNSYGSVQPMCAAMLKTSLTQQRIRELRAMASPSEGDVCGPQWPE